MASGSGVSSTSISPSPSLSRKYGPTPTKASTEAAPMVITSTSVVLPSFSVTSIPPYCSKAIEPCKYTKLEITSKMSPATARRISSSKSNATGVPPVATLKAPLGSCVKSIAGWSAGSAKGSLPSLTKISMSRIVAVRKSAPTKPAVAAVAFNAM